MMILLLVGLALVALLVAARPEGGYLRRLAPVIHGHR
jgi:hypothetical protein